MAPLILWMSLQAPAHALGQGEFLVFPSINAISRDQKIELNKGQTLPQERTEPAVDFFFSRDFARLRILAEFFVGSSAAHGAHFERLQLGLRLPQEATLWTGRFHNPLGYWNTQYHHGNYLETAITRPGIAAYESDGGILPMHLAGLLLEGRIGSAALGYDLALGLGPEMSSKGLEELDILNPDGTREPAATLRLRYQPIEEEPTQYGIFLSRSAIPDRLDGDIRQTALGTYANWEAQRVRLTGALYRVQTETARYDQTFTSGYLQAEKPLGNRWTLFARLEDSWNDLNKGYLQKVPAFVRSRQLGGIRLELRMYQALKLEFSNARYLDGNSEQILLQWSAVIP